MAQNPYLAPPGGMDPAKMQRQQARTDRQNARTAGQQMQTAMPAQPMPMPQPWQPGPEQGGGFASGNAGPPMETMDMPGQAQPLQQVTGDPYMTAQLNDPAAVAQQALVQAQKPQGAQLEAIRASMGPLQHARQAPPSGGFQPKQMLGQVQGMQRAKQMESMARPSAVRGAFKAAQTTGAVPGVKPPKPPQY